MKKLLSIAVIGTLVWGCNNTTNTADEKTTELADAATQSESVAYNYYGDTISPNNAVAAAELAEMISKNL